MKVFAIEKELVRPMEGDLEELYKEEALHVYGLYQNDILREIYFDQETCAVIMLECDSIADAKSIVSEFPLVKAGLITFEIHALKPYSGYGRLIEWQEYHAE